MAISSVAEGQTQNLEGGQGVKWVPGGDEGQAPRNLFGVKGGTQLMHFSWGCSGADFATKGILDTAQKFYMGAVDLAGAFTDPKHMSRAVVPFSCY